VLHLWAEVAVTGPEDVFDPRYTRWISKRSPDLTHPDRVEEAQALSVLWAREPQASLLHALPDLLPDLRSFSRLSARPLRSLAADEVACPALLASLCDLDEDLVELSWVALALRLPAWSALWPQVRCELRAACADLEPVLGVARELVPALRSARVELVPSLGPRGRALPQRLLIGAPLEWNDLPPRECAVQAAHEACVRAGPEAWAQSEWQALREVALSLRPDRHMAAAHRRWLGRLDIAHLATEIPEAAELLATNPRRRAAWFKLS
jgi:hypothetical protein